MQFDGEAGAETNSVVEGESRDIGTRSRGFAFAVTSTILQENWTFSTADTGHPSQQRTKSLGSGRQWVFPLRPFCSEHAQGPTGLPGKDTFGGRKASLVAPSSQLSVSGSLPSGEHLRPSMGPRGLIDARWRSWLWLEGQHFISSLIFVGLQGLSILVLVTSTCRILHERPKSYRSS